jgi:arylsulfatase A-like enzyme
VVAAISGCSGPGPGDEAAAARRPNVVLIVLDTTRADILSAYGYEKPTSPSLAAIASEGMLFRQALTTDFWTLPAHASLLTGEYPSTHQATAETNRLSRSARTLAEYLRAAGYRTRAYVSNAWIAAERGFGQGFESYIETWRANPGAPSDFGFDRAAIEGAEAWIHARVAQGENFFLFLNLNSAHMPYSPDTLALADLSPGPRSIERTRKLRGIKGMWGHLGGAYSLESADFEILRELYEAEVAMVDGLVGRLMESLRAEGVLDDTLVIVTADHGENLGEHGMVDHLLSMYETTIRIPLVMRHPASFAMGSESDALVSLVDVVPTVLDICGLAERYPAIAERSLLRGGNSDREFLIAENDRPLNGIDVMKSNFPEFDTASIDHRMRMLRTERHKLIWTDDGRVELYDLLDDPEELHDLSGRAPELRDSLLARLEGWMAAQQESARPLPLDLSDPQTREQLRALGYIE